MNQICAPKHPDNGAAFDDRELLLKSMEKVLRGTQG